ncbi:MAG: hypothetical protein VYB88_17260 [Pseudomonadota bacterium]|uniref:hypothetical protein n=1 Tax=Ralstonia pickettii TaxID=329 RepID=UPI002714713D|nr:hypothetical protein [Ralstonia pickettii]MEE2979215.1 hypothetical protein [Pseudomonadota bacterium]WKZ87404.1 hypothetical protein N5B55_21880 [Ralstonia pickettii]
MDETRIASRLLLALLAMASLSPCIARAQQPSMEERLRAQLRATTTQLQQTQAQLAQLQAAGGNAPASDASKKELADLRAQLDAERARTRQLSEGSAAAHREAQTVADKANTQITQLRAAYEELLRRARASEAERQKLVTASATQQTALQQCEAKNAKLYAVGQEVLNAYESMDVTTVIAARQPFATRSRVKYEQIAQAYGDKLYEGRFDPRAVTTPAPASDASAPHAEAPKAP